MTDYSKKDVSAGRTARRRCSKCRRVGYYWKSTRVCGFLTFGRGSYSCGGQLIEPKKREPKPKTAGDDLRDAIAKAAAISPEVAEAGEKIRAEARAKLSKAQDRVTELVRDAVRTARLLDKYQKQANYYAKRAAMTNEDVAADRARRLSKGLVLGDKTDADQ